MAERRAARRSRVAGSLDFPSVRLRMPAATEPGGRVTDPPGARPPAAVSPEREPGPRRSRQQEAGPVSRAGDPTVAAELEAALLERGPVDRVTHPFHTYPAALHPDAARRLLGLGEGPVLDPFCGGGTVLVEALLAGRESLGCDISGVATLVARARTRLTTPEERTALRVSARSAAAHALAAPRPPDPPPWVAAAYEPHVYAELHALREAIGKDEGLRAVFSSILVKVSRRASDTRPALLDTPRPPGTAATLFHARAREYARLLDALATAAPPGARARVHREDARELRLKPTQGLVLTSPPYPGVYDYLPMQALRAWWLGLDDRRADGAELGSRRAFHRHRSAALHAWAADTARWVRAAARALRPGGRMVVVVGDGWVHGAPVDAWAPLKLAAEAAGLAWRARATVERWDAGPGVVRPEHAGAWQKPEGRETRDG